MAKDNKKKIKSKATKKPKITRLTHKIDATDQILGRLASQIANLLRGKNKPTFTYHIDNGDFVVAKNAAKLKFSGKKFTQKAYHHYSGYPGGLKTNTLITVFKKNPALVLRRSVWNMLPKNKLRAKMIKRLIITN